MCFDYEEKRISDALAALDSELETPDLLLGIRKKLDGKMPGSVHAKSKRIRRPLRFIGVIAAVVAVIGITAAAISLGGFDWLREKADPPFGDVVKAIEQSVESQGIKVTAAAAQNYSDMAVLYLTLEDMEGLGRVAEDTQLSFAVNSNVQSFSSEMIYFDTDTGIAAYQIRLGAPETFDDQSLSLHMDGLRYGKTDLAEIRMDVDLVEAAAKGEHIGEPYADSTRAPSENLTPGHMADISGTKSAWISAIGVDHGYLAVQLGQPVGIDRTASLYNIHPYLLDAHGNRVETKNFATGFSTNENLQRPEDGQQSVYDFTEYYFAVDTDTLEGYTLCFEGTAWNIVPGDWNLDVDFGSLPEVREVKADIAVGEVHMTDVVLTISPLGMTLTGNGAPDLNYSAPMTVTTVLETTNGDVEISSLCGVRPDPNGPYELTWHASSTIDIDSVKAIRIGDNRIPLK